MRAKTESSPCRHYIPPSQSGTAGFCKLPSRFHCEEALKHHLPAISQSTVTDFMSCRLKYYFRKIMKVERVPGKLPDPIKAGALWDTWNNSVHLEQNVCQVMDAVIEEYEISPFLVARVRALTRAFRAIGLSVITEDLLGCQYKMEIPLIVARNKLVGHIDRAYCDYFIETKLSARPDFYTYKENIEHQVSTYFLGNPDFEYVDMEITRLPGLKTGKKQYSDEGPEAYGERCYQDIISRPSHYFLGFNRDTSRFGKRFYRAEFNLEETEQVYWWVCEDIERAVDQDRWYGNHLACYVPTECLYHPICKTGVVSEELFRERKGDI